MRQRLSTRGMLEGLRHLLKLLKSTRLLEAYETRLPVGRFETELYFSCLVLVRLYCMPKASGAGFGAFFGALTEAYRNPPTPTPSDKVVLAPVKSDRTVRLMQSMGRNAGMMAMIAGIFTVSEVRLIGTTVSC